MMKHKSPSQERATAKWFAKQTLNNRIEIALAEDIVDRKTGFINKQSHKKGNK